MTSENRNILLGTFVLLFGTLCLVISSRGGIESSVDGYKLHALFQNIDGVTIGTDVVLSGVKIGKVTSQTYVPDGHRALVTMHIRNDIQLPIDSVVLVLSSGMLGGKYLKLEPGGEVDTLEPGDVVMTGTPAGVAALKSGDRLIMTLKGVSQDFTWNTFVQ